MSLRANFLGVDLKDVRKYSENASFDNNIENESFVNSLVSYILKLESNIIDDEFLSQDIGQLFQVFYSIYSIKGRSLFGFEIKSSWSLYAYLTNDELGIFIEAIKKLPEDYQLKVRLLKYTFKDYIDKSVDWLEKIKQKNLSLFFYAN